MATDVNENPQFAAALISRAARALAGFAAAELLATDPRQASSQGDQSYAAWQAWMTGRLEELAAAVATSRPSLFVSQIEWARQSAAARAIDPASLQRAIGCLKDVLRRELPASSTAIDYMDRASRVFQQPPANSAPLVTADTPAGRLAAGYLVAVLEGDRRRAIEPLIKAASNGMPVRDIYLHVLEPAQQEVGRMWLAGEVSVAEEHFATATTRRAMALLSQHAAYRPGNGKTLLAAAVAGNRHDLGLQVVADFFEMDGWRSILLGADVPVRPLVEAVEVFEAHLVALGVALSTQWETLRETIALIRHSEWGRQTKILVGGTAVNYAIDLAEELGADGYALDAQEAVRMGRQLVGLPAL